MPCGCEAALAPCEVPSLASVPAHSTAMASVPVHSTGIAFDGEVYSDPVLGGVAVFMLLYLVAALLVLLAGRGLRRQTSLCRLDLAGRFGPRPARPREPRLRLVLSARERAFFAGFGALARAVVRGVRARPGLAAAVEAPPLHPKGGASRRASDYCLS